MTALWVHVLLLNVVAVSMENESNNNISEHFNNDQQKNETNNNIPEHFNNDQQKNETNNNIPEHFNNDQQKNETNNNIPEHFNNDQQKNETNNNIPEHFNNDQQKNVTSVETTTIDYNDEEVTENREDAVSRYRAGTREQVNHFIGVMTEGRVSSFTSLPLLDMKNCVFRDNSTLIECHFVGIAYDYVPFVRYNFHIHFLILLKILTGKCEQLNESSETEEVIYENATMHRVNGSDDVETTCLLSLWEVKMRKVDVDYRSKNVTSGDLGPNYLLLLSLGLDRLCWEMRFSSEAAVGLLHLHPDCSETNRNDLKCIHRLQLLNFMKLTDIREAYGFMFWETFRLVIKTLGGYGASLIMKFYGDIFIPVYVSPIMNSTKLSAVSLTGHTNWSRVESVIMDQPDLTSLDLSNNNITFIDTENFRQAPNIEELNLSHGNLQKIPEGISLLSHLRRLDLSYNNLQYIQQSNIIHKLSNLTSLYLSHTPLRNLNYLQSLLRNTSIRLQALDISYCNISSFDDTSIFQDQTSLQIVDISGNNIVKIPPKLFSSLPNLRILNLSHLNLSEGPNLDLGLRIIHSINLSHNRLTDPTDILASGQVSNLDLSFNLIKNWSDPAMFSLYYNCDNIPKCNSKVLPYTTWVQNLNLSYNLMPTVTKTMGESLTRLKSVDLGKNPFQCLNCHTTDFKHWLRQSETNLSFVALLWLGVKNPPSCTEPGDAVPISILDVSFVPDSCLDQDINYWAVTGIVLGSLLVMVLAISVLILRYKFEVTYLIFLLRQRKKQSIVEVGSEFEFDAFVCYSRQDRLWVVNEMVPMLENSSEKFRLCLHERDFILGSFISLNIVHFMQHSRYTVLILSSSFIKSQWCRWELEMANHKLFDSGREFLILLELERLSQITVPRHLKYLMDTRTYLEWPESGIDPATAWKRLKASLGKSIYLQEQEKQRTDKSGSSESVM